MNLLLSLLAMHLPDREHVTVVLMHLYQWVFGIVFVLAVGTILFVLWHLIPKKEY